MPEGVLPGLGVLTAFIPRQLVDEAVGVAGCREKRSRLLPAWVMVYFVLGMCLLSGEDSMGPPGYRSVVRSLSQGTRHEAGLALPSAAALCRGRVRLGGQVMEVLFGRLRGPLARPGEAGSFALGRRVLAWDGTTVEAPATEDNCRVLGCNSAGAPMMRLMALVECGTHAIVEAAMDGYSGDSEAVLARRLLHALEPGMLLLADRYFPGHQLWGEAAASGADLLWRARSGLIFPVIDDLKDGSWISVMPTPEGSRRRGRLAARGLLPPGHRVRVIEYHVTVATRDGRHRRTERFRLLTTMLDPAEAPAASLAELYHLRWECEGGYLELKARLKGSRFTLRSRHPVMAAQEMTAYLCVTQALAAMRHQAAATAGVEPSRLSFTATLRIARDHARAQHHPHDPRRLATALARATADMLACLNPPRRHRQYPRQQKPRYIHFPLKPRNAPRYPPGPITTTITPAPP